MPTRSQGPGYQVLEEIPPGILPLTTGMMALGIGVAGWMEELAFLRYVDIPLTMILFVLTAWLALHSTGRGGNKALIGVVLGMAGCASPLVALLVDRGHPLLS